MNGFDLKMTIGGRFWGSKIEKFQFFFFWVQDGFLGVWGWFGVFINGFWAFLVEFGLTLVS